MRDWNRELNNKPEATNIQEKWQVNFGDVWVAGDHVIYCGDCLEIEIDEQIDLVHADPPYGISIVRGDNTLGTKNRFELGQYAKVKGDDSGDMAEKAWQKLFDAHRGAVHVWWGANNYSSHLPSSQCWLFWDKKRSGNYADGELAWTNHDGAVRVFRHMWNGMYKESETREKRKHPTQKPIALAEWVFVKFLKAFNKQTILDPFAGAGFSVIGAQRTGHRCIAIEYEPAYVAVILERLKAEGLEPRLEKEGETS